MPTAAANLAARISARPPERSGFPGHDPADVLAHVERQLIAGELELPPAFDARGTDIVTGVGHADRVIVQEFVLDADDVRISSRVPSSKRTSMLLLLVAPRQGSSFVGLPPNQPPMNECRLPVGQQLSLSTCTRIWSGDRPLPSIARNESSHVNSARHSPWSGSSWLPGSLVATAAGGEPAASVVPSSPRRPRVSATSPLPRAPIARSICASAT